RGPVAAVEGPGDRAVVDDRPVVDLDKIVVGEVRARVETRLAKGGHEGDNRPVELVLHESSPWCENLESIMDTNSLCSNPFRWPPGNPGQRRGLLADPSLALRARSAPGSF